MYDRNVSSHRMKGRRREEKERKAEIGSCFIVGRAIGLTVI